MRIGPASGAGRLVALLIAGALAGACSSFHESASSPDAAADAQARTASSGSSGGGFASWFPFGRSSTETAEPTATAAAATPGAAANAAIFCPSVDVLDGTAAYPVYVRGREGQPNELRYQASFSDFARECSTLGAEAVIRVGVKGRIVLGPQGTPGRYELPVRVAIVDQDSQPVYSKLHRVAVDVSGDQDSAPFVLIDDDPLVPIDSRRLRGWKVVVGFDSQGDAPRRRRQ